MALDEVLSAAERGFPPGMQPQTLARVMAGQTIDTEAGAAQGQGK